MTDFKTAYSNLIKASWQDPSIDEKIVKNPALLKQFGFDSVPNQVRFETTSGKETITGYDQAKNTYQAHTGLVTFYIPKAPSSVSAGGDDGTLDVTACCCCCPCCTCT